MRNPIGRLRGRRRSAGSGRVILLYTVALALLVAPLAAAAGEGRNARLGVRNPSSGALSRTTEIIADSNAYGTRQSNLGSGGGAIYGCRGGPSDDACIRGSNLRSGRAFSFQSESGTSAGNIQVGSSNSLNATAVPFTTNAGGTVENLDADQVDGQDAAAIIDAARAKFAVVTAEGGLARKRGATTSSRPGVGQYIVTFDSDVSQCAYQVTIAGTSTTLPEPAFATAASVPGSNVSVQVGTTAAGGGAVGKSFHLSVNC